ncbi:Set1 complex component spp1 [Golovinomyces cichoracearum]|uniref:Set1 complex component spp1 n=1 Tax=Golovinomyces cichoracearum TaxID=62708 RepID=A0A420INW1_9PEZI|nr:Set1 complex component spp1 [Golovinomyces cichoracearum]
MSISEKVKAEGGRNRKASSIVVASNQNIPTSTRMSPMQNPSLAKIEKETVKKPTSATAKKPGPKPGSKSKLKQSKQEVQSSLTDTGHLPKATGPSDSDSNDGGEYCICRGPDDHRMMVNCEGPCKDWYHCSCLGIDVEDAKELLDRYVCPKCSSDDFFTTYKPMCRYHNISGCRKSAQVCLKPNPSMYCSEQHRRDFWNHVATKLRSGEPSSIVSILSHAEVSSLAKFCNDRSEWQALGTEPRLEQKNKADPDCPIGLKYVTPEEAERIESIHTEKAHIKGKIELVQAQKKLLIMIHEHCKVIAQSPQLEVKDFCGYDNRLALNEIQFIRWKQSEEGKKAFETGVIGPRTRETMSFGAPLPFPGEIITTNPSPLESTSTHTGEETFHNYCFKPRKKCKHNGWRDIHGGDYQLTITNYEEHMARLQAEEDEIIQEAEIREATKDYHAHNVTIQHF